MGATGMLGQHAAWAVQEAGHELVVLHRAQARLDHLRGLSYSGRIADLDQPAGLPHALRGLDAVILAAAYYPTAPKPWRSEVAHALAQLNGFYAACAAARMGRIVYVGDACMLTRAGQGRQADESCLSVHPPGDRSAHLQVKWAMDQCTQQVAQQGLPVISVLPGIALGEYDFAPNTGRMLISIANATLPAYLAGECNVVYAGDVAQGALLALEKGRTGQRYLLTGEDLTTTDWVARIARAARVAPPRSVPPSVGRATASLQSIEYLMVGGDAPKLPAAVSGPFAHSQRLSGAKARQELGYAPQVGVDEAIARTLSWFKRHGYLAA